MSQEDNAEHYHNKGIYKNELEQAISISVIKASEELCRSYERPQYFEEIQVKLECGVDNKQSSIISGILERLQFGTSYEFNAYIGENFEIPLGIKLNMINIILQEYTKKITTLESFQNKRSYLAKNKEVEMLTKLRLVLQIVPKPKILELWINWKSGKLSPEIYFQKLHQLAHNCQIDKGIIQELITYSLEKSGWKNNYLSDAVDSRFNLTSSLCDSLDIQLIVSSLRGQKIEIFSTDGSFGEFQAPDSQRLIHESLFKQGNKSCRRISSSGLLWWEHIGDSDQLLFLRGQHLTYASEEGTSHDHAQHLSKPTLLVGDSIKMMDCIVDIDQVISVDAWSPSMYDCCESDTLYVSLVVEGRKVRGGECGESDGVSELGDDDDDPMNSSGGSGHEENGSHRYKMSYSDSKREYFCFFASCYRGVVRVHLGGGVHSFMFPDQVPNKLLQIGKSTAILYGSNALLGVIHGVDTLTFSPLTEDSYIAIEKTHSNISTITSVSYSQDSEVLISGDNNGLVCMWSCSSLDTFSKSYLISQYQAKSRINSIFASPCGQQVVVGLYESLLLLCIDSLTVLLSQERLTEKTSSLYAKGYLDNTMTNAIYNVSFSEEFIRVWRITPSPSDQTKLSVTGWNHPNIDLFDERIYQEKELDFIINLTRRDNKISLTNGEKTLSMSNYSGYVKFGDDYVPLYNLDNPLKVDFKGDCVESRNQYTVHTTTYLDNEFRNYYSLTGLLRPLRGLKVQENSVFFMKMMISIFEKESSDLFKKVKLFLAVYCASLQLPAVGLLAAALDMTIISVVQIINYDLKEILFIEIQDESSNYNATEDSDIVGERSAVCLREEFRNLKYWLCSPSTYRIGEEFWIDSSIGHNKLCALYLKYCGNKSVAVEHAWQNYLRSFGPTHLRQSSRGLKELTTHIRKMDETANIKGNLPYQIGYISGLQEIYARRVGLGGVIPEEIGELDQLRVLSMGNNNLTGELPTSLRLLKNLQRIVLHQNNLQGSVPETLGDLGCIVNLAGNPLLKHGPDVPTSERDALTDIYLSTKGHRWITKQNWNNKEIPVSKWYKVGILSSHVHSIVMSSNGMVLLDYYYYYCYYKDGKLPVTIAKLTKLRMIELATMPGLTGPIPTELCQLITLRRLCICRCSLQGKIPFEIGQLIQLEELQLFGNHLTGIVPNSVGNLTNLKLLSLGEYTGGNEFTSMPLPSCISRLVKLEALFMANCNLKGSLPSWIGELTELRQLDLQRNSLSGAIPITIGKLENLLYLNMKDNDELTDPLPLTQILTLNKLNRLSLVHCNFHNTEFVIEELKNKLPRCKVWI